MYDNNMPVVKRFLGWRSGIGEAVAHVVAENVDGPLVDLHETLILVASRKAGRRLREALLNRYSQQGGFLSPRIITPGRFLDEICAFPAEAAEPLEVLAIWAEVLQSEDLSSYSSLFPVDVDASRLSWALETARLVDRLREDLAEGGWTIRQMVRNMGAQLPELARWRDLARLEERWESYAREWGRIDPVQVTIGAFENPAVPEGISRLVVAAVPDPPPWLDGVLQKLAESIQIEVVIHAPEEEAELFDSVGRPDPEAWADRLIPIDPDQCPITVASDPRSQGQAVIEALEGCEDSFSLTDLGIGVPDAEIAPSLEEALSRRGIVAYAPRRLRLSDLRVIDLLELLKGLLFDDDILHWWKAFRHPDLISWFARKDLPVAELLSQADDLQRRHLPIYYADLDRVLDKDRSRSSPRYPDVGAAVKRMRGVMAKMRNRSLNEGIRLAFDQVYGDHLIDMENPEENLLLRSLGMVFDVLDQMETSPVNILLGHSRSTWEIFLFFLKDRDIDPAPMPSMIDLEGWLELPWNPAPHLLITGINEGVVPESGNSDPFLSDGLRIRLGLRHDAMRFARDAFLFQGLLEGRREEGSIRLFLGKTSIAGDFLKPSRLLLREAPDQLVRRAQKLFSPVEGGKRHVPVSVGFQLRPRLAEPVIALPPASLSVTSFRNYLECPFRFYLNHVLGMEAVQESTLEMDSGTFGTMIHQVLEGVIGQEELATCTDSTALVEALHAELEGWIQRRFGSRCTLPLEIQRRAAHQRLAAAAVIHAESVQDGWESVAEESMVEAAISGVTIRGKIDRIERHRSSGRMRILDYKTADRADTPPRKHLGSVREGMPDYQTVHVGGKEKAWMDLQLPLYLLLLESAGEEAIENIEVGYFLMPKAVTETCISVWEGFDDSLLQSARNCVYGVLRDIHTGRYWPPSSPEHDPYEALFGGSGEELWEPEF